MPDDLVGKFKSAVQADTEELAKQVPVVVLMGQKGSGKSASANSLCGFEVFQTSAFTESETSAVNGSFTRFAGIPTEDPLLVVDTPGIGDSKGRDAKHIGEMVVCLKELGYAHAFLIVLNYSDPRRSEQLQDTIKLFSQMFGSDFF